MNRAKDIIDFARDIKNTLNTSDPYVIADYYGIMVNHTKATYPEFTAHTIRLENYPTIISINDRYSDFSKRLLCAHELGHALLHGEGINHFAITNKNIFTNVEYEANLFALALLTDVIWEEGLTIPLEKMSSYLLKTIMDYNVERG